MKGLMNPVALRKKGRWSSGVPIRFHLNIYQSTRNGGEAWLEYWSYNLEGIPINEKEWVLRYTDGTEFRGVGQAPVVKMRRYLIKHQAEYNLRKSFGDDS